MNVLDQLSSRAGNRTEASNLKVAALCIEDPALLEDVAKGLVARERALLGDCAEVMTEVARTRADLVAPYAEHLLPLLDHKHTRVRWEATHALALVVPLAPDVLAAALPHLEHMVREDQSIIVRDYAVDAVANYAAVGPAAAKRAHPMLVEALRLWGGRHAHHAWPGLRHVAAACPETASSLRELALEADHDSRAVVRKAAKSFLRSVR